MKNKKNSEINIVKALADSFKKELISENNRKLIDFVFSKNITQESLDNFLQIWNFEKSNDASKLFFAYFMKLHTELTYPANVVAKLKGVLNLYKIQNLKLLSHYKKICNELSKENIEIVIFKGGVMKHLRPEFPRVMGDIDILVKEENYQKSGQIAEKMGYECAWDIHSVDLHPKGSEEGIMDIHKYIYMNTGKETNLNQGLFERAKEENVFGIKTLVPSKEDLVFITLVNLVRNLRNKTSWNGILFTLYDILFLTNSKEDFDWEIIIQNAQKTGTELQVYLAIEFLNNIIPNLLPQKIEKNKKLEKELDNYCTLLMYKRFCLWNMKQKGHDLKFNEIFHDVNKLKAYLYLKPKYFILKSFIFTKFPKIAKIMLKLNKKI